jgi:hypothetical protein
MSQYFTQLGQLSNLIEHVAEKAVQVVPRISIYTPGVDEACLPPINIFVLSVVIRSYTTVPELMMSLIYLSRFRNRLFPDLIGCPSTPHRVALAAMMLVHKVHNDDSVKNACWADISAVPECGFAGFSNAEVNLMETQFLIGLDWDVHINADLYDLLRRVIYTTPSYPSPFLQTEPGWVCECCICVDGWVNPAQGLPHCIACVATGYAEAEMQKTVFAPKQPLVLQPSPSEHEACIAIHHQAASVGDDAPRKYSTTPKTNAVLYLRQS